jgi:peptide/nickel transport system permease protein
MKLNLSNDFAPHSLKHPLGTDDYGRDVLKRLMIGGQISLEISFIVIFFSSSMGLFLGIIAGYFGGIIDEIIMRIVDVLLSFPGILLALTLISFFGNSILNLILALSLMGWVVYARLARGIALKTKQEDYILATKALGAGDIYIMIKHILPSVIPIIIVQASLGVSSIIIAETGLSFLGLGVPISSPSWGNMINAGRNYILINTNLIIYPSILLMITVIGFNYLGEGLRKFFSGN